MNRKVQNGFIALLLLFGCFSGPNLAFAAKDTTKPVISGASNKTVYQGYSFNPLAGVAAKDKVDGNLTKKVKVTGSVNVKRIGTYKLVYSVSDKAKNKATVTRMITVKKDTVKPVITGASNKTIFVGSSFNPLTGISAKDNVDGNITKNIKVSGTVNTKKAGVYKLVYSVSDKTKNTASLTRTITVKDNVKPVMKGATDAQILFGASFDPLKGVTASDNNDGNITSSIKVSGIVNVNKAGKYVLTYTVSDKAKNTATVKRTVTVVDIVKPVISGAVDKEVFWGEAFDSVEGVSAVDNNDGNLTAEIILDGMVDVNKAGEYVLTYSVSDSSGNTETITRKITVLDNIKPVISGTEDKVVGLNTQFYLLEGVTAADNNDGDLTSHIKVVGSVDTKTEGNYQITYKVSDAAGNNVEVSRNISVQFIHVANVAISAPDTVKTGKNVTFTANISPMDATNQMVTWKSSDESVATINDKGVLTTIAEGTVTITATVDGVSGSKAITVSDRPNLSMYSYGSVIINGVIQRVSINLTNYDTEDAVTVDRVSIYENNSLVSSYSENDLINAGISPTVYPYSNWGISISFKLGIWQGKSKVIVTVKDKNGKTYDYSSNL